MPGIRPNAELFTHRIGQVKVFSMVLGIIAMVLCTDHHYSPYIQEEEGFFWSLVVCVSISLILGVFSMLGLLDHPNMQKLDQIYHFFACILLIIIACFFIVSVDKGREHGGKTYDRRAAAGGLGLIYGIVCGSIGGFIC